MGKNQQKTTFNDASGLLNSLEGNTANTLATANSQDTNAQNAYAGLGPSGIAGILSPANAAAGDVFSTGGYSQPQLSTLENQEASNLGGLDPTALNALSGQYQNLISSGGISDATQAAMQRQATSGVSSLYGTLNAQQQRTQAMTGGQGGGGQTAEMARNLAQQESNAITGVNSQVGQLRQQGTEAGLSGASSLAAAQAAAQNSAANTFSGTQGNVAGGIQSGANLMGNLGSTQLSGNLASAGGLTNLYGTTLGEYGQQLGAQGTDLGIMSGIANNMPPWYSSLKGATGAISGVGSALGGAIAGV